VVAVLVAACLGLMVSGCGLFDRPYEIRKLSDYASAVEGGDDQ